MDIETQAANLLTRIDAGDPDAVRQWADLAQSQAWPCHGYTSWAAWAQEARADLALRNLTATANRLETLERLPLRVGEGALQGVLL